MAPMKPILRAGAALLLLAGCGQSDKRFELLTAGITKDSVNTIMGIEKPQRVDPFLLDGKYVEVTYYRKPGVSDSMPDRKLSPLILVDGTLVSWGWKALDSLAEVSKIHVAPK